VNPAEVRRTGRDYIHAGIPPVHRSRFDIPVLVFCIAAVVYFAGHVAVWVLR